MYIWYTDFITKFYFIFLLHTCIRCRCICFIVYLICLIVYSISYTMDKSAMTSIKTYISMIFNQFGDQMVFVKMTNKMWQDIASILSLQIMIEWYQKQKIQKYWIYLINHQLCGLCLPFPAICLILHPVLLIPVSKEPVVWCLHHPRHLSV